MEPVLPPVPPVPAAPADRRTLVEETVVVLLVSTLVAGAVNAIISLATAPVSGVAVAVGDQSLRFYLQVIDFALSLGPALLVLHLARRSDGGLASLGLDAGDRQRDLARAVVLFIVVAVVGIAIYLGAVALHMNRFVVPVPPRGHWWTVPALFLNAISAGLVEEIIVLGYLVTRLQQLRWPAIWAVLAPALLRGTYHLYQGWGGFVGNLLMGLFFGALFLRWRRTWPFVVAHVLLDVGAGLGYLLFHNHLPGFG
ncbi:MAG: CPBP family intramembrane glutamic endopeptidase, partial [Actinomycetota bacterium]